MDGDTRQLLFGIVIIFIFGGWTGLFQRILWGLDIDRTVRMDSYHICPVRKSTQTGRCFSSERSVPSFEGMREYDIKFSSEKKRTLAVLRQTQPGNNVRKNKRSGIIYLFECFLGKLFHSCRYPA